MSDVGASPSMCLRCGLRERWPSSATGWCIDCIEGAAHERDKRRQRAMAHNRRRKRK